MRDKDTGKLTSGIQTGLMAQHVLQILAIFMFLQSALCFTVLYMVALISISAVRIKLFNCGGVLFCFVLPALQVNRYYRVV